MKMKKLLSLFTFAAAAAIAPVAAEAAAGDIVDIRVMDMTGKRFGEKRSGASGELCSPDNPVVAGEEICIRVRMIVRNASEVDKSHGSVTPQTWIIDDGEDAKTVLDQPMLGLRIGEKNVWATYSHTGAENWQFSGELQYDDDGNSTMDFRYFTDFYFKYTVQPGDMGLPVKLLNKDFEPADESRTTTEYAFGNVNCLSKKFVFTNESVGDAQLYRTDPASIDVDYPNDTYPLADYNLAKECLYVKTVDFDKVGADGSTWQEGDVWRKVYPGISEPVVTAPAVSIQGGAKAPSDIAVYVWCDDESVAYPVGDEITSVKGSDGVTRKVLTVHIGKDATGATFALEGASGAAVGAETYVCMSPTKSVTYNPAGTDVSAYVRRRVTIAKAPQPTVQMRFENGETMHSSVTADADYQTAKMQLVFKVVPAATEPVTVTLSATASGSGSLSALYAANVLRIPSGAGFDIDGKETTVTINPGETETRNVFVLGATEATEGGVNFKITKASGPSDVVVETYGHTVSIQRGGEDYNEITASNPTANSEVKVTKGETKTFKVKFSDTYKNITKSQSGYTGYTFFLEDIDSGDTIATATDVKVGSGDWFSFNAKIEVNPGTYSVELYAKSPDEVTTTKRLAYGLVVADSKKVVVTPTSGLYTIGEGDQMPLKLSLNSAHKGEINRYIFLAAADPAQSNLVKTTLTTTGAYVDKDYSEVSVPQNVQFLDGDKTITLNAFLANSQTDPTDLAGSHTPGSITVTVTNKPPQLLSLNIAGNPLTVASDYGKVMDATVPMGIEKVFKLVTIDEVEADRGSLSVLWTIDGKEYETNNVSLADCAVTHAFAAKTATGSKGQLVEVKIKDKDMLDYPAEPNFRCWVKVTAKPNIEITTSAIGGLINETDANVAMVQVTLSEPASTALQVLLKVQKPNTGVFKLRETENSVKFEKTEGGYDYYRLYFTSGAEKLILISEMDGTDDTLGGIDISAAVDSPDSMKDYYDAGQLVPAVRVQNVPPEIKRPTETEEAYTNMNASANTPYSIFYGASDVKADLEAGLDVSINVDGKTVFSTNVCDSSVREQKVEFDGPGAHVAEVVFVDKDQMTSRRTMYFYVSQSKVLKLRPHGPAGAVGSSGGYSAKYHAAKGLGAGRVYAGDNGPQKVLNFEHTYSFSKLTSSVGAWAFGYKADETLYDNGSLQPGPDQPIDKNGNWSNGTAISEYYNYALDDYTSDSTHKGAKGLDSFVYGWACNNSVSSKDSESGTEEFVLNFGATGSMSIPLPDADDEGDSSDSSDLKAIPIQYWEVLFSAELLKGDNCGDMNGDGIPDLYVQLYKFDVLDSSGLLTGDDLRDLNYASDDSGAAYCVEGDYLPSTDRSAYSSLIPGLPETWITTGNEFTPVLKIRGFPEEDLENDSLTHPSGLNDAAELAGLSSISSDRVYTNPETDSDSTLSYVEWLAWSEFKAAWEAAHPGETASTDLWSPERPTDPTMADTDRDGLTDGYEYWVWYRAHVGWVENYGTRNEVHKRLVGRRYDPRNPGEGVRLSSEEIAKAFDPRSASGSTTRDTDNDGLPDILEFTIGTCPYDFDTDGDGLPDGWEIMIAGLDPTTSASSADGFVDTARNYDGDAMAIGSYALEANVLPKPANPEHAKRWTFAVVDPDGDSDGVQWYAMTAAPVLSELDTIAADSWWQVTVGSATYCATEEPVTVGGRLAAGLTVYKLEDYTPAEEPAGDGDTLLSPMLGGDGDAGAASVKVLGFPVRLEAGTLISVDPGEGEVKTFGIAEEIKDANACWIYGRGSAEAGKGEVAATAAEYGCLALARPLAVPAKAVLCAYPSDERDVAFLHFLCYQEFGFDPRTAWSATDPLAARWASTINGEALSGLTTVRQGGYVQHPTRTRDYTAYDEFLVCSFFYNNEGAWPSTLVPTTASDATSLGQLWAGLTTNPQGPNEPDLINSENYAGRSSDQGADTDLDGVPDGWELYIMAGPKVKGAYNFAPPYAGFLTVGGNVAAKSYWSPFVDSASATETTNPLYVGSNDTLNELREFSGTDCCAYYADNGYSTTILAREDQTGSGLYTANDASWLNKFFPTDPWSRDTDGDGISDSDEASYFVYGSPADGGSRWSIAGGGLNPCTVDTDLDGLPDGWEAQYRGSSGSLYSGSAAAYDTKDGSNVGNPLQGLTDGMDGTVKDACNYPDNNVSNETGIRACVNRDYDRDGLDNWQEYLVGTMRCWRYDDPVTPTTYIPNTMYFTTNDEGEVVFDAAYAAKTMKAAGLLESDDVGEFWYKTLKDPSSAIYNPHLVTDTSSGAQYFSRIKNGWDLAYYDSDLSGGEFPAGAYYWFCNRIDDTSLTAAWAPKWVALGYSEMDIAAGLLVIAPTTYVSCSPIDADTDRDGLDDYYELFHGMNPLLGQSGVVASWMSQDGRGAVPSNSSGIDIIYDAMYSAGAKVPEAWGSGTGAGSFKNYWQQLVESDGYAGKKPRGTGYDFEVFPWLNGLPTADADGDGTLNQEEGIMGSVAPLTAWHHSDPTPLWMTDSTYTNSLTRMFYRMPVRSDAISVEGDTFTYGETTYNFCDVPGFVDGAFAAFKPDLFHLVGENSMNYIASFEENEGFDSDHDGLPDSDEVAGKYRGNTDSIDADSPRRRQAMYFQGKGRPSILQTMPTVKESHPVQGGSYPDDMSFLHYTVECWVKAESLADATVIERASWIGESNPGDQEFLRCNFQLGIKDGKWYTKYDPNDTTKKSVSAMSEIDATTSWTHLAATYDGTKLALYVDGELRAQQSSGEQPAYGSSAVWLHGTADTTGTEAAYMSDAEYQLNAIVVGASVKTVAEGAKNGLALDVTKARGWASYTRFFTGYVDEIRIWDGARSGSEIKGAMNTRFTADEAKANRESFYTEWCKGGANDDYRGRYAKDESGNAYVLPAELRYHWSFDSVFGAVDEARVAKAPQGFDFTGTGETTARAVLSRPENYEIAWWKAILAGYTDTVYSHPAWVEWVPNTVAHLPRFDGTTLDSVYWSEDFMGGKNGTYTFQRSAEPVSRWTQMARRGLSGTTAGYEGTSGRHYIVNESDDQNQTSFLKLFDFTSRHLNQYGDDLLPLGGAYVKQSGDLWDEQGASSNWEIGAGNADSADGIPSWWAAYAQYAYLAPDEVRWDSIVTWPEENGVAMTAGEAYLRDIARGYTSDADGQWAVTDGSEGEFAQTYDMDGNGIPDWWEDLYGLSGVDPLADSDNDGLSNYTEYLLSEVFDFKGVSFSPINPRSVDSYVSDYFYKVGDLYAGEIFTDHDLVDDAWEDLYPNAFSSRLVWDAFKDSDADGWSNRAEVRYSKQCMPTQADKQTHYSASDGLVADYPIPTIELTLNYNEALAETVRTSPIVVEVRRNASTVSSPDASFSIGEVSDARAGTGTSSDRETDLTTTDYTRTLGKWSNRHALGTLTPGYVNKDSVALEVCTDPSSLTYTWMISYHSHNFTDVDGETTEDSWTNVQALKHGTRAQYEDDLKKYSEVNVTLVSKTADYSELEFMELRQAENSSVATWVNTRSGEEIGTIDLTTGAFDLNLGVFAGQFIVNATNQSDFASLEDQTFRISYSVNPAVDLPRKLYLGAADSGYVKEGLNQIVAFFDLNGDGAYTAGEPYGVANDVNVSWKGTSATIELNEVSPVTPRFSLWSGSSNGSSSSGSSGSSSSKAADRPHTVSEVYQEIKDEIAGLHLSDAAYENAMARLDWMTDNAIEETVPEANENIRLRVVRWLVNGRPVWRMGVNPRVVVDKQITYRAGTAFTEADVLTDGELDLDWSNLSKEVISNTDVEDEVVSVKRVDYLVVIGDGPTYWKNAGETNVVVKALSQVVTRYFGETRAAVEAQSPSVHADQVVRTANPTFSWTVDEPQLSGYTAFKIQVADASGATVFDSGVQPAPARDANGCYTWSAPLYVGDKTTAGAVYQNDAYYTWKVSMYNAKYRTDSFSTPATYLQATQTNGLEYGTARVAVKYFGPKDTFAGKTVRVRAFTSPDFTGTPVAAGYVAAPNDEENGLEVSGREIVENCSIVGLPKGEFYLQAFIDSNGNGVWDSWESMGYLCDRSGEASDWLDPVAVSFGGTVGKSELATIYIEDADTDGDSLPDAWEVAKYGSLEAKGIEAAALTAAGEYVTEKGLSAELKTKGEAVGGVAGEVLYALTSSKAMMALASGIDPEKLEPEVEMTITGLKLNVEAGTVDVSLKGEVTSMGEDLDNAIYTYAAGDSISFQVYHTETLAGEWQPVGDVQTVKVTSGAIGEQTLSVAVDGLDTSRGGFFKIVVK